MNEPTKIELKNWCISADIVLGAIECQDEDYRNKVCRKKCTKEMRKKRKCEDMGNERTFCQHLVKARQRNKKLQAMKLKHELSSPFIKGTEARKAAEYIILQDAVKRKIPFVIEKVNKK